MIVAIVNQTSPSGLVQVEEFREAVDEATAVNDFVNSYSPPRNSADWLGFNTGWAQYTVPPSGSGYSWYYDFDTPGLVEVLADRIDGLSSDDINNTSAVAGANVTAAVDALDAARAVLSSDDISNDSITVAGASVTAAVDALEAARAALGSSDISNDSITVAGASVTAAIDALDAARVALSSDDISNDSVTVAGASVTAAIDALDAARVALSSDDIANDSVTVTGATVTAAIDALEAARAALGSDDISNDSLTVAGASVTAAIDALEAARAALGSDDISNDSVTVSGATVTAAIDALEAARAALSSSDISNASSVAGATVTDALDTLAAAPVASHMMWGSDNVAADTTTRYLHPGYAQHTARDTPIPQIVVPFDGTLDKLYVRHNFTNGNGNAIVYTLRVNGVATALSVSLASTATQASDLVNSVAVVEGDLLDIEVTKAASIDFTPVDILATLRMQAT